MQTIKYIFILLLLMAPTLWADTETLIPDGVGIQDDWASSNADSKVNNVTDGIDGEYTFEVTDEENQYFTLSNTTFDASATIDSFDIVWRAQDNGSGNNRVQIEIFDGVGNCEGPNQALTTSWVTYTITFLGSPSGIDVCAGTFTKAKIDSYILILNATSIGASREVRVTEIEVIIYFTPAGAGAGKIMETIISHKFPDVLKNYRTPYKQSGWIWNS